MGERGVHTQTASRARCVVFDSGGASPVDLTPLLDALRRRRVGIVRESTAAGVVMELVKFERSRRQGDRPEPMVVVLARPAPEGREILRISERYTPHVVFWEYEASPAPRLRPVTHDDLESDAAAARARPDAAPSLRLTSTFEDAAPLRGARPAPVLSDEELAMLLGEDPREGPPGA